jgi:TPR repeat protein
LAEHYCKLTADQNMCESKYRYALILRDGDGINQNVEQSIHELKHCAKAGDVNSQFELAMIFLGHRPQVIRSGLKISL